MSNTFYRIFQKNSKHISCFPDKGKIIYFAKNGWQILALHCSSHSFIAFNNNLHVLNFLSQTEHLPIIPFRTWHFLSCLIWIILFLHIGVGNILRNSLIFKDVVVVIKVFSTKAFEEQLISLFSLWSKICVDKTAVSWLMSSSLKSFMVVLWMKSSSTKSYVELMVFSWIPQGLFVLLPSLCHN